MSQCHSAFPWRKFYFLSWSEFFCNEHVTFHLNTKSMQMCMQTRTDPHACAQTKRHSNVQFLVWCWVREQDVSTEMPPGLPFHTGQAQFQLGLLQPVLHFSNSKTQKRARAFDSASQCTGSQSTLPSSLSCTPTIGPLSLTQRLLCLWRGHSTVAWRCSEKDLIQANLLERQIVTFWSQ